ncbi:hypothetical protein MRB53_002849 [Persea americana]|uniref:Uncharacterized protein n=2 Tax=Persea americana TaxID=3435 RepID=A0ACC2MVL8_PERAE|nr:hypothetical protein MRB53_002837 [Persea americana]KAJ8649826.1 hypothetical protein MRB53_002849 [Persea americana]
MKKAVEVIDKYHEPIIDERIRKWKSGEDGRVRKEPEDLLDILISVQDTDWKPLLTLEEIKAEAARSYDIKRPRRKRPRSSSGMQRRCRSVNQVSVQLTFLALSDVVHGI